MSSHQRPRKLRALCRHLSLILPDTIARRISPGNVLHLGRASSYDKRRVTINILPDDVLLHIFHFIRAAHFQMTYPSYRENEVWDLVWRQSWWHRLVHVCQRWRSVFFASQNSLDLRLVRHPWMRVRFTGIWRTLPIIITGDWPMGEYYDLDAAIVHPSRVCEINLHRLTSSQLQQLVPAMQERFPALVHLMLHFGGDYGRPAPAPALPDGFLGGSAPRLKSLRLHSIPFPALPKFLLSSTDLVHLTLWDIPRSGYISLKAIVACLAALANLKALSIGFESPLSLPDPEIRHPPLTRTALPTLTRIQFKGVSRYLEYLVASLDAPLLDSIWINFFDALIFDLPQLAQFMRRTTRFQALSEAHVVFDYSGVQVGYLPQTRTIDERSGLRIACTKLDGQLSSVAQVFTSFFPSIHMVEHLYISGYRYVQPRSQEDIENVRWLEFFRPFTAVKNLYIADKCRYIVLFLKELVEEGMVDALPALESTFLGWTSGPVQEGIHQLVTKQQHFGHPVAIYQWNRT